MEYTIGLDVNYYNGTTIMFGIDDVEEIIGQYNIQNKNEVIEKFNNLVHNIESKDDVLLNELNDDPWHKVYEIDTITVYLFEETDEDVDIFIEKKIKI